jgi:hypothetical protein
MEVQGDVGRVECHFVLFGDNVSVDVRYVHDLRQTYQRLKIVLDAPDGTPRCEAQVEARFSLVGDSANLDTR